MTQYKYISITTDCVFIAHTEISEQLSPDILEWEFIFGGLVDKDFYLSIYWYLIEFLL